MSGKPANQYIILKRDEENRILVGRLEGPDKQGFTTGLFSVRQETMMVIMFLMIFMRALISVLILETRFSRAREGV